MVSNQKANMNTLEKLNTTLENEGASTEEALKFFDELESVNLEFMIGRWQGYEFPTNHPMDGLLKASITVSSISIIKVNFTIIPR